MSPLARRLQGSDADNITPDHVVLRGTLRALTHAHMMYIKHRIEEVVPAVVSAYRCNGSVDWLLEEHPYYPPTVNDPAAAAFVQTTVGRLLGEKNVSETGLGGATRQISLFFQSRVLIMVAHCHTRTTTGS
jgi:IAA-amino acid hydrolase